MLIQFPFDQFRMLHVIFDVLSVSVTYFTIVLSHPAFTALNGMVRTTQKKSALSAPKSLLFGVM